MLGEELIVDRARQVVDWPEGLLLRLRHMVISHHGTYEWQSPKRPKTVEACILHLADYTSSQVALFVEHMKTSADRESWTSYVPTLERSLFLGSAPPLAPQSGPAAFRRLFEEPYQGY